jgi:hypothetical protein
MDGADGQAMLRHATYRNERPWLSLGGDLFRAIIRPRNVVVVLFLLATASQFGVPVGRLVPAPVKQAYADGRAWSDGNADKLSCATTHVAALKSNEESKAREVEQRCAALQTAPTH